MDITSIFISIIMTLMVLFIIRTIRVQWWVTKNLGYIYTITFKNLETYPDLTKNTNLKDKVRFVNKTPRSYVVQSKINDAKLTEILKADYQLADNQVHVQTGQLSFPIGAI